MITTGMVILVAILAVLLIGLAVAMVAKINVETHKAWTRQQKRGGYKIRKGW